MTYSGTNAEFEKLISGLDDAIKENIILPVRVSYKIIKNRLALEQALIPFKKTRDAIIVKYSDGEGAISEKEQPEQFKKACSEIALISKEKVEAQIDTISLSDLENNEIPLNVISAFGFMMNDE